jgi:hypothetical protein
MFFCNNKRQVQWSYVTKKTFHDDINKIMLNKSSSNNFQMIAISTLKMMMLLLKLTMKKMKKKLFAKKIKC